MTRARAKELLPVIEAFARGEEVQEYQERQGKWIDVGEYVSADCRTPYRIKPKPLEVWCIAHKCYGSPHMVGGVFLTNEIAENYRKCYCGSGNSGDGCRIIKMVEVTE